MVIEKGAIWWADLGEPTGSTPARTRPVVVVQADAYNRTQLATTIVAAITSRTSTAAYPGNVFVSALDSRLPKDSVVNVTALLTLDRRDLRDEVGPLPFDVVRRIDEGLRGVLGL